MAKSNERRSRWLSTGQAAEELGVNLRTVYRFLDEGALTGYKFGRVMRLKSADVEAFIESSKVEPGTLGHLYPPLIGKPEVHPEPGLARSGSVRKAGPRRSASGLAGP